MDELEVHMGEVGKLQITLYDAAGNETPKFDDVRGITYEDLGPDGTASDALTVNDPDDDPFTADVTFNRLTPEGAHTLQITVDGKVGEEENLFTFRTQPLNVAAGEAASGTVQVQVEQVSPPL